MIRAHGARESTMALQESRIRHFSLRGAAASYWVGFMCIVIFCHQYPGKHSTMVGPSPVQYDCEHTRRLLTTLDATRAAFYFDFALLKQVHTGLVYTFSLLFTNISECGTFHSMEL